MRFAGGLLVLVGLANTAFGVLGLATDLVRLTADVAGVLLVLGVGTAALGATVWRGSRAAVVGALALFGSLLVVQLGGVVQGPSDPADAGGTTARLLVLGSIVGALAFAWLHGRQTSTR